MTHFRLHYLMADNRICGMPAEFSAADREEALKVADRLYAGREPGRRRGVESWNGVTRIFVGDPSDAVIARDAA